MMVAAAHPTRTVTGDARRLLATLILVLAFALQSYVTQTHFHRASPSTGHVSVVGGVGPVSANGAAPRGVSPTDHESDSCPFCQAIVVAGAFFIPAPLVFGPLASLAVTDILRPTFTGLAIAAASFSWRSRAPPHH